MLAVGATVSPFFLKQMQVVADVEVVLGSPFSTLCGISANIRPTKKTKNMVPRHSRAVAADCVKFIVLCISD